MIASSNTTRGKWCGTACRQAAAISPKGFNRISPSTTWPRRHPRSRVQIVTKYAPAGNGWGTARRARTGGDWNGDGVCKAISFNPLVPQPWGTTKREYLRDTLRLPVRLRRTAPSSVIPAQAGIQDYRTGRETSETHRDCLHAGFQPPGPESPKSPFAKGGFQGVRIEGHPQTSGSDLSLHPLRIADLEFGATSQTPETIAERRLGCCACRSHIDMVRSRNGGGRSGRLRPPTP